MVDAEPQRPGGGVGAPRAGEVARARPAAAGGGEHRRLAATKAACGGGPVRGLHPAIKEQTRQGPPRAKSVWTAPTATPALIINAPPTAAAAMLPGAAAPRISFYWKSHEPTLAHGPAVNPPASVRHRKLIEWVPRGGADRSALCLLVRRQRRRVRPPVRPARRRRHADEAQSGAASAQLPGA
jgi:hypothetical protein